MTSFFNLKYWLAQRKKMREIKKETRNKDNLSSCHFNTNS